MPVSAVWGVGRNQSDKLQKMGIHSVLELQRANSRQLRSRFGVVMERTVAELNGVSCLELEDVEPPKQQIISSRSFHKRIDDLDALSASVAFHISHAAEKLRAQGSVASVIGVSIRTNPFRDDPQYRNYACQSLPSPTADTLTLNRAAQSLLRDLYRKDFLYHKAGVVLMGIGSACYVQPDMFSPESDTRRAGLMATLDKLHRLHGHGIVRLGSEMLSSDWEMRRQRCSPCYSSNLNQVLVVNAG
jgi:DNA polymerase V